MSHRTIIIATNIDDAEIIARCDMRSEAMDALRDGSETAIQYEVREDRDDPNATLHLLYLPNAGRGAACTNGDSRWTDCDGIDDLADRWANYEERWSN